jgi:hypothetical protein
MTGRAGTGIACGGIITVPVIIGGKADEADDVIPTVRGSR